MDTLQETDADDDQSKVEIKDGVIEVSVEKVGENSICDKEGEDVHSH